MRLPNPSRETEFSGANRDREISVFPLQLTTSRIGNLTRLIHTLPVILDFELIEFLHKLMSKIQPVVTM